MNLESVFSDKVNRIYNALSDEESKQLFLIKLSGLFPFMTRQNNGKDIVEHLFREGTGIDHDSCPSVVLYGAGEEA